MTNLISLVHMDETFQDDFMNKKVPNIEYIVFSLYVVAYCYSRVHLIITKYGATELIFIYYAGIHFRRYIKTTK